MTSPDLLPCPFCNSADVELRESITDAYVACNNCGCRTGLVQLGRDDASAAYRKREVVAIWNQRASIDDEVRMLREALWSIALEAHETIPPRGKDAAFATLRTIQGIAFAALKQGETHGAE